MKNQIVVSGLAFVLAASAPLAANAHPAKHRPGHATEHRVKLDRGQLDRLFRQLPPGLR